MNRRFPASSRRARSLFAAAAAFVALMLAVGMDGLAGRYQGDRGGASVAASPGVVPEATRA